ncbi:Uncharacterised protein [Aerococcus viridans]|nr:Uncharacterised protein [Aerococcus viridans]
MQLPPHKVLQKKDIKEYILPTFLKDGRFGNPFKLYKKNFLEKYDIKFPEDRSLGEDFYFNLEVFTYCQNVYYINKSYYHYRQSADGKSLMNKYRPELYDLYLNNSPKEGFFKKWGMYSDEVKYELSKRKCYVAANGCIQNEFKNDCKNSFREKINVISNVVNHQDVQESASLLLKNEKNKKKRVYLNMLKNKNVIGLFAMGKLLSYR